MHIVKSTRLVLRQSFAERRLSQLFFKDSKRIIQNCFKEKWWVYKPDSVLKESLSFIWCSLPPDNGRAALDCRYTWPCRRLVVPPLCRHNEAWALTPHFHPYFTRKRLFSVTICQNLRPAVISTESCSFLSGLSSPCGAIERPTDAKVLKKYGYWVFYLYLPCIKQCLGVP